MYDVVNIDMKCTDLRIGVVNIRNNKMVVSCDICVYKREKLWIRMPEVWLDPRTKRRFNWFENTQDSEEFQKIVLKKVFDMIGLTLDQAIQMRKDFFSERNKMTRINK